mmetsp:Transcript_26690/g.84694  ORF Transcript_26690/g.84694 Transcript_26690/m.84694 type:complete len:503 (+) Transcript_26690:700-2208(+)
MARRGRATGRGWPLQRLHQALGQALVHAFPRGAQQQLQAALALQETLAGLARRRRLRRGRAGWRQRGPRQRQDALVQRLAARGGACLRRGRGRAAQQYAVRHARGQVRPRRVALQHPQQPLEVRQHREGLALPAQRPQVRLEPLAGRHHGPERRLQGLLGVLGDVHGPQEVLARPSGLETLLARPQLLHSLDGRQHVNLLRACGTVGLALGTSCRLPCEQRRQDRAHGLLRRLLGLPDLCERLRGRAGEEGLELCRAGGALEALGRLEVQHQPQGQRLPVLGQAAPPRPLSQGPPGVPLLQGQALAHELQQGALQQAPGQLLRGAAGELLGRALGQRAVGTGLQLQEAEQRREVQGREPVEPVGPGELAVHLRQAVLQPGNLLRGQLAAVPAQGAAGGRREVFGVPNGPVRPVRGEEAARRALVGRPVRALTALAVVCPQVPAVRVQHWPIPATGALPQLPLPQHLDKISPEDVLPVLPGQPHGIETLLQLRFHSPLDLLIA